MTEEAKQLRYGMFRFKMWMAGKGTYEEIDRDFADGKLDKEWEDHCRSLVSS